MKRILVTILLASSAYASELEVPVGVRAPLKSPKAIQEIVVRDPSLITVTVKEGAAALEGKQGGVTALTVRYADGELEKALVVVGDGQPAPGMNTEQAKKVEVQRKR